MELYVANSCAVSLRVIRVLTIINAQVVMSIKNLHSRCQTSYLTKTTGSSSSKEKGGPVLKYLTMCLDSMGRRILSLLETRDGYETWKVCAMLSRVRFKRPACSPARCHYVHRPRAVLWTTALDHEKPKRQCGRLGQGERAAEQSRDGTTEAGCPPPRQPP